MTVVGLDFVIVVNILEFVKVVVIVAVAAVAAEAIENENLFVVVTEA